LNTGIEWPSFLREARYLVLAFFLAGACDPSPATGGAGGASGASGASGTGGAFDGRTLTRPGTSNFVIQLPSDAGDAGAGGSDASGNAGGTGTGAVGSGGSAGAPVAQCMPVSLSGSPPTVAVCGDGFRTGGEACDDGNASPDDACSAQCQITPELVSPRAAPATGAAPLASRTIGAGRHPLAAGCNTVAVAFADHTTEPPALLLSTFSSAGVPQATLPIANLKVSDPNPGVAVLPGDALAVAWTDFDDDELGVRLRKIVPGASAQSAAIVANEDSAFSQSEPDIIFDGSELVVAWVDSHDPTTSPDIRYRLFAPDLTPLTGDQTLAATDAVEDNVVLAGRNGHWAAAWRAGSQGMETIEVQSGSSRWTVGPFLPGATDDRPDLIFLDDSHLAVAFTEGTDPDTTGEASVPRLHAAVLDPNTPGATESFQLLPAQLPYATEFSLAQTEPSLVLASDHLLVAWRSSAISGDHRGSELWSRRVPFTVSGDTVTLDPSHLEALIIQSDAQREGDQDAFRMVGTTLGPSGVASVWDDASHSFGAKSGGLDVVLQVAPDLPERAPPSTSYAVSDNGFYYDVNLLRRNYPGPTISRSYQGDATYVVNQLLPEYVFDGDDNQWMYQSASGSDPNAGATLTIDMGQYFSVGAVRILYYYTGNTPVTQTLRLGSIPSEAGNWQTILDDTPGLDDHTYSFNAITARFLELKMKGPFGGLMEVMVYPSTQTGPPPSPTDGYDLSYFATVTANSNCGKPFPWLWTGGTIYANVEHQGLPPYAMGDCVGTYDLGAQYPVSRVYLNFYVGSNWASGGRVDIAAVPGAYSNIYNSGVGNQFGYTDSVGYTFPSQPVRYVRMTDYAVPGGGPAGGILESIQAFATPPPRVAYFPLSDDSKYFKVNVLRRPTGVAPPTVTVAYGGTALPYFDPLGRLPENVIDGDDLGFGWQAGTSPDSASATITVDLGQTVSLGAIRHVHPLPGASYGLRVAETSGSWTTIVDVNANTPLTTDQTVSFGSTRVRYIELTLKGAGPYAGLGGNGGVGGLLSEIMAYPSSTAVPAPSSESHLDLTYLNGISVKPDDNMLFNGYTKGNLVAGAWRGKTIADGATGDATLTFDLGQQYQISQVNAAFWGGWSWPNGGKVEVDDGSGTWSTAYDSGRGTPLAPSIGDGSLVMTFSARPARRVRLTQYLGTASATTMVNIEIF
jgi:cysteine-rich repeat protein